jgi:hypothetical protein
MFSAKALLVALPIALAGTGFFASARGRVARLRTEVVALDAASRREGASFVETLQGAHAERQRELLDRRRAAAVELAGARRDELLGALAVAGSALAYVAVRVAQRVAAEVEEDRRILERRPAGGPRAPLPPP